MGYSYSYDKKYFDPVRTAKCGDGGLVNPGPFNFSPIGSGPQAWDPVREVLLNSPPSECKLIFVSRHGKAEHNIAQERYTKPIYYRFIARDPQYFDSELTVQGVEQTRTIGRMLHKHALIKPECFYSSSLRRCISTSINLQKAVTWSNPTVHIKDEFREWLGWGHKHSADSRRTKTHIMEDAKRICATIRTSPKFPEADKMFNTMFTRETYIEMDRRVRLGLDDIFDNEKSRCISLVLHNQSFQSFMRIIEDDPGTPEFKLAHGATVAFLVTRKKISLAGETERYAREGLFKSHQLQRIPRDKTDIWKEAAQAVADMAEEKYQEMLETDLFELEEETKDFIKCRKGKSGTT